MNAERRAIIIVCLAIVVVSFAAILIRLCTVPTAVIAAWRLGLASLMLLPIFAKTQGAAGISRNQIALCILAGLFLSLHFLLWIESLKLTTVASSVVLVTTSPIFAAILGWIFLKESVGRRTLVAIGCCMLGSLAIGRGDIRVAAGMLRGDLLALGGAAAFGGYFVIGRSVRRHVRFLPYVFLAYSASAVMLLGWAVVTHHHLVGFAPANYLWLLLLALGPQVFGHSSLNWALGHLPAPKVAISVLGEPIGSALLAWLIFHEVPGAQLFIGGVLILCGVYLAMSDRST
ncbi:MAG TPA: DMT family transporter [bacterium]|nr:DMT family transporter [bacterium]